MSAPMPMNSKNGDSEKASHEDVSVKHEDHASALEQLADPDAGASPEERAAIDRKLLWRLDLQLIPWLALLYLLSFLDRTNIGNAKIAGLPHDLGDISSAQYNAALTVFFVAYAVFEPLTNVLLKRLRPSIFIPIIMILWGTCMTLMGLVSNWSGLMAARWFLGLAEAGLFPGVNYYLSCWYKRSEFGIRAAIFFSAAAVAGSFGGLLAAAISLMEGIGNLHGWQWIFILEGLATVVAGALSFYFVHDFPDEAKFLSTADRLRVIRRLKADQQSSAEHEEFKFSYLYAALKDYKMYLGMIIYMGTAMPLYAFSLFLPTIISGFGYNTITSQLLTVPVYAAAAILTITIGFIADRTHQRGLCNISVVLLAIVGFGLQIGASDFRVRYAGTFLGALGIYPCISNTISWMSNNIEGVYKRGVVLGFVIGWGNINGIVSSNIYRAQDSPHYYPGHSVCMAYMVLFLLGGSVTLHLMLKRENKLRRAGKRDVWLIKADGTQMTTAEAEALGDRRPDFFYTE